jgi:hypothetical protein
MVEEEDALRQVSSEDGKIVEIEDSDGDALEERVAEDEGAEDEVGIFDEDLRGVLDEELVEELEEGVDEVSDFFIGDTILSTARGEESWSKEDLEQVIRDQRIEKDWQDSEEFVGGDFYEAAAGGGRDFYGEKGGRDGFYETDRGDDLYKGESGGGDGVYNVGEGVYAPAKTGDEEAVYDVGKRGMKSYDEVADNRRKGRSMLEQAGFVDAEKQKHRDSHSLAKYNSRKAA